MLRKKALVAFASFGLASAGGSIATAQLSMYGSDTLFEVTNEVIGACGLSSSLVYRGTGSSQGGKAMGAGDAAVIPPIPAQNQQVAPQSRFMNAAECSFFSANQGQGINIGLDALSIVADNSAPTNTCNTLRYTGSLSGFTFDDWRDVLRVVYTGQQAKVTLDPCSPDDPARTPSAPGNIAGRCDSPLRQALVANWGNLFEGGCSNGDCPNGLRHAFRRDDVSGTTDAFLTLLGLPAATTRTFCNGFDTEDLDPIRRVCDANEQVCSNIPYANRNSNPNGGAPTAAATNPAAPGQADLGLVLPVSLPTNTAFQYGPACALGNFEYAAMPFAAAAEAQRCPDGQPRKNNQCRWPRSNNNQFNCRAVAGTRPPLAVFTNMDGRSYNLVPRDPTTGALLLSQTGVADPRWGGGGWYRLHQTAAMANGTGTCTQNDATEQIGCLVNADPCSIGYAGREAAEWNGAGTLVKALNLRSPLTPGVAVAPTDANALLLLDPSGPANGTCGNGAGDNFGFRYPLARKLWINASKGFGGNTTTFPGISNTTANGVTSNENMLMQCIANRANNRMDTAIDNANFIRMPAGAYPSRTCP